MLIVILLMSLMFIGLAFILTESNAKTLLAGYNTMSAEEQAKVDIRSVISLSKKFHLFLGFSFAVLGYIFHKYIGPSATGIFVGVYPILMYMYFIWRNQSFDKNPRSHLKSKIGLYILGLVLVSVLSLFYFGLKENVLLSDAEGIEISGMYGLDYAKEELASISLVGDVPKIKHRVNGFSLGEARKGHYKSADGEKLTLILNAKNPPYILLEKGDGAKTYFSAKEQSNQEIFNALKSQFPNLVK